MQVTPRVDMTGTPTKTISTSTTPAPQGITAPQAPTPDPIDKKLETYAKKEQEIRQMIRNQQAEKDAWQKEKQEYESKFVPKETFDKTFASPESVMAEMLKRGVTPQQLNEYMLQQPNTMDPAYQQVQQLKAEIAELRANQNKQVEQMSNAQKEQITQALNQITTEAKEFVADKPEYKIIKAEKAEKAITKVIEETYYNGMPGVHEPGYVMTVEQAAKHVKDFMTETAKRQYSYIKEEAPPVEEKHPILARQPTKTITNQVTPTTKKLSPRDRAVLLMQGKL